MKHYFPIFQNHPNLIYLDSAATALKPQPVIDAILDYYANYSANIHRGLYDLSMQASDYYEQARERVAKFINAQTSKEIVFTKSTTESLNLVAFCLQDYIRENDKIILTTVEHHANLLPWQVIAKKTNSQIQILPLTLDNQHDLSSFELMLDDSVKVVSIAHASNVLGLIAPVERMVSLVRTKAPQAIIILDSAQSITHLPTDVQKLGVDLMAFSGHKLFGPTGIGVLWGKHDLLEKLPPYQTGGGMVSSSDFDFAEYHPTPDKFEAGTPPIAEAIGLGHAVQWIESIGGATQVHQITSSLTSYLLDQIQSVPGLKILGNSDPSIRVALVAFTIKGVHPHDISQFLSDANVCVRAGHHCALPLHKKLGILSSTRISLQLYNTQQDIDQTVKVLNNAVKIFSKQTNF